MDKTKEENVKLYGWFRGAEEDFEDPRDQNLRPRLSQIYHMIPLSFRYSFHFLAKLWQGRKPAIDQVRMRHGKKIYGVPCGGIGGGTIGRGFRGEFCRFQMVPGIYNYETIWANAFHLIVRDKDKPDEILFQSVLGSKKTMEKGFDKLSKWEYNFADDNIQYRGLYPRSWLTFFIPELDLELVCEQISPFIPHNYKDSSLPVSVFRWTVKKNSSQRKKDYEISIGFTFRNGWSEKKNKRYHRNLNPKFRNFETGDFLSGSNLDHNFRGVRLTYAIAACNYNNNNGKKKSGTKVLNPFNADLDGSDFYEDLKNPGNHSEEKFFEKGSAMKNIGIAVMARDFLCGDEILNFEFGLCWEMPEVKFRGGEQIWTRYYTQFFPRIKENTAQAILEYSFKHCDTWIKTIEKWQNPILGNKDLPDWFKSAIFNEMYYIADGGTQWLLHKGDNPDDPRDVYGRFLYLESHEYRLYNTYDVHFYASCALICLFPGIQLSVQSDFCDATTNQDLTTFAELYKGKKVFRNCPDSVPHDLGDPEAEPISKVNAYVIHDVSKWRDLRLKFVISVRRDYAQCRISKSDDDADLQLAKCAEYLMRKAWPICVKLMSLAELDDNDNDGLIENNGTPDQTFDSWVMTGPSSYCNSLWLSALACMAQTSKELLSNSAEKNKENCLEITEETVRSYEEKLAKTRNAFHKKLWSKEGKFFKFDSSESGSNVIMSDQLCGCWYLSFCDIDRDSEIFDQDKVRQALKTIYNFNVIQFAQGKLGAVNGMLFDQGKVDESTVQSEEIWTGVTYALASLMISQGNLDMGFRTAEGIYRTVYDKIGMAFETPEALYKEKHYRAIGYMRPLSIWSMVQALEKFEN